MLLFRCLFTFLGNYLFTFLQIELDLLRTLPNNKHYDNPNADGIPKLRRVLLAYSVHNPDVEYCQVNFFVKLISRNFFREIDFTENHFWFYFYCQNEWKFLLFMLFKIYGFQTFLVIYMIRSMFPFCKIIHRSLLF